MIKINICMPIYFRAAKVKECLDALKTVDASGLSVQICIGLNGSNEEIENLMDGSNYHLYYPQKNIGQDPMFNKLAELHPDFDYIVCYDSDIICQSSSWIKDMLSLFAKYPNIAAIAGMQIGNCCHVFKNETFINDELITLPENQGIAGGVLMVPKTTWMRTKGFQAFRVFAAGDAFFMYDCFKLGLTVGIAQQIQFYHPFPTEEEKEYNQRKRDIIADKATDFEGCLK